MTEVTRPIEGFPHYGVTADGRVFNLIRGAEVAQRRDRYGYFTVCLWSGGKRFSRGVHTLVAAAHHGPKPTPKHVCRHLNGDRNDNRADNLAWGTSAENAADTARHGKASWLRQGIERPGTRLPDEQVLEIAERANRGESTADLALEFGICRRYVYQLRDHRNRRYLWGDIAA